MHAPLTAAATTGDLTQSVNYSAVSDQLTFVAAHGQWGLLESLAHALCAMLLLPPATGEGRAMLTEAEVLIRKPEALKGRAVPCVRTSANASFGYQNGRNRYLARGAPERGSGMKRRPPIRRSGTSRRRC